MREENLDILNCDCKGSDKKLIAKLKKSIPKEEKIVDTSAFLSVFGDGTRLKILWILRKDEVCVCDIASVLKMTKSAISHQLRILKQFRLVSFRKDGQKVYYSLSDHHVADIIEKGFEHTEEIYE